MAAMSPKPDEASPYTGASEPSDEAVEAAHRASTSAMFNFTWRGLEDDHLRCEQVKAYDALAAAYAVDFPARLAEAHAAGRREQLDEIVAMLREKADGSTPSRSAGWHELADAIVARFSEQERPHG